EELAARAVGAGMAVAWGRCHEDDDAPAFWPWVQVLRTVADAEHSDPLALLARDTGGASSDAAAHRFRLYEGVRDRLVAAAVSRPLVVVLDDLHWADPESLALLAFLAVHLRNAPIAVVGALRDESASAALDKALAALARQPTLERL